MSSDPSSPIQLSPYERLRLEPDDRIAVMSLLVSPSARSSGAERAHRLPNTVQGWFFYQKWKNYRVVLGAMKGMGGCVLAYALVEAANCKAAQVQCWRARLAGLGVGMLTGATQDAVHWRAGRPPAYLVWAQQKKNELIK
ncbi:hypothetical protein BX661DRAFT_183746 [Kickxella alabastrina]|uniref:uncharacterized protein n=1 Tax=Kickxella alabastrina TaxID=61397 RepID=UPI00221E787D|nr:uncharacterized protein BX661DRAFT_183746 [Kickxella alabastrina]KAI7826287.1 hypothetical protein BX661DRAFT_183746 [Kickxella alabastrina]